MGEKERKTSRSRHCSQSIGRGCLTWRSTVLVWNGGKVLLSRWWSEKNFLFLLLLLELEKLFSDSENELFNCEGAKESSVSSIILPPQKKKALPFCRFKNIQIYIKAISIPLYTKLLLITILVLKVEEIEKSEEKKKKRTQLRKLCKQEEIPLFWICYRVMQEKRWLLKRVLKLASSNPLKGGPMHLRWQVDATLMPPLL